MPWRSTFFGPQNSPLGYAVLGGKNLILLGPGRRIKKTKKEKLDWQSFPKKFPFSFYHYTTADIRRSIIFLSPTPGLSISNTFSPSSMSHSFLQKATSPSCYFCPTVSDEKIWRWSETGFWISKIGVAIFRQHKNRQFGSSRTEVQRCCWSMFVFFSVQPQWPNFPSPWATMLALCLDCSTVALPTPQKALVISKPVELKMIDFSDRTRTDIYILTSAADYLVTI